jgi:hypothetical protein
MVTESQYFVADNDPEGTRFASFQDAARHEERIAAVVPLLSASKPGVVQMYHNDTPEHRAARQAVGIEPADSLVGDMIGDLQAEQTYISSDRERCHPRTNCRAGTVFSA